MNEDHSKDCSCAGRLVSVGTPRKGSPGKAHWDMLGQRALGLSIGGDFLGDKYRAGASGNMARGPGQQGGMTSSSPFPRDAWSPRGVQVWVQSPLPYTGDSFRLQNRH